MEPLEHASNQLLNHDRTAAISRLYRRIIEEQDAHAAGDEYAQDNVGQLEKQLAAVDAGDTAVITGAAQRERAFYDEAKLQYDLRRDLQPFKFAPASFEHMEAFTRVEQELRAATLVLGHRTLAYGETVDSILSGQQMLGVTADSQSNYETNAAAAIALIPGVIDSNQTTRMDAIILDEGLVFDSGCIGQFDIWDGTGSHPATVFQLYADGNVKVIRRFAQDDGIDSNGDPINPQHEARTVGWLDTEQLYDLQAKLAAAEPC